MKIKKENGKIIKTMTFSECFFGFDSSDLSREIINSFNEILLYPYQPERLSPEDRFAGGGKAISDSLNSMET